MKTIFLRISEQLVRHTDEFLLRRMAEWSLMLNLVVETLAYLHTMDDRTTTAAVPAANAAVPAANAASANAAVPSANAAVPAPTSYSWSGQISAVSLEFTDVIKCLLAEGNRYFQSSKIVCFSF
jgi:hypothetical protein